MPKVEWQQDGDEWYAELGGMLLLVWEAKEAWEGTGWAFQVQNAEGVQMSSSGIRDCVEAQFGAVLWTLGYQKGYKAAPSVYATSPVASVGSDPNTPSSPLPASVTDSPPLEGDRSKEVPKVIPPMDVAATTTASTTAAVTPTATDSKGPVTAPRPKRGGNRRGKVGS